MVKAYSKATVRALGKYGAVACSKAFELNKSGEGAASILHGHDCGFRFVTVGQVDAAINAGRELADGRQWTAVHGKEEEPLRLGARDPRNDRPGTDDDPEDGDEE